jgi:predicted O-methyltransferase YrrM
MNLKTFYPPYAINRMAQMRFAALNPWAPWLTAAAITALQDLLKPADVGFEFGSGRSTVWLARRVRFLYSMEHVPEWYERVRKQLEEAKLTEKVQYHLASGSGHSIDDDHPPNDHPYLKGIAAIADDHLDFVLVDGIMRRTCVRFAISKIRPGGLLILDNANRYMSNEYQEGHTTVCQRRSAPKDPEWGRICTELSKWRGFNATDRIWDTRFWLKPHLQH